MNKDTLEFTRLELAAVAAGLGDQIKLLEERVRPLIDETALHSFDNALTGLRMVREHLLAKLGK